jgi:hypothetical protein
MRTSSPPLRFSQHVLAVLCTATLGSTIFTLIWTAAMVTLTQASLPAGWLAGVLIASWIAVFMMALPGAAIVFSLLWPATRHGSVAGMWICVIAGAALGIVLAPLASPNWTGASLRQIALFAVTGAAFGGLYVACARRLAEAPPKDRRARHSFRHRLPAVASHAQQ